MGFLHEEGKLARGIFILGFSLWCYTLFSFFSSVLEFCPLFSFIFLPSSGGSLSPQVFSKSSILSALLWPTMGVISL
jgi:hypothetical protein